MQFLGPPFCPKSRRIVMEITSTCNIVMLLYVVREVLSKPQSPSGSRPLLRGQLRRTKGVPPMSEKPAVAVQTALSRPPVKAAKAKNIFERMDRLYDTISRRAFEL